MARDDYKTEVLADKAVSFIGERAPSDRPVLLVCVDDRPPHRVRAAGRG